MSAFTTAEQYRAEIERLKNAALSEAERYGLTSDQLDQLADALGVVREDAETRAAREELEALHRTIQKATRTFLPRGSRDGALRQLGVPVPSGRVGTL